MICGKCSAVNEDGDRFCYKCGAQLAPAAENASASGEAGTKGGAENTAKQEDRITLNATTMLAAKEARQVDVKNMRPLTRTAYNIVESDHGSMYSSLVSILCVLLSLGMVAALIEIFDIVSLLMQSVTGEQIEGSLWQQTYSDLASTNAQKLLWMVLLFFGMAVAFVMCGRLSIRISKVNRKKKRESLDARL